LHFLIDGLGPTDDPSRRDGGRAMQVLEHPLPMRDPSGVQPVAANEFLRRGRRPHDGRGRALPEPARPGAVDLGAIALEAKRVVAIGADLAPVPEPGVPFPARRAECPEAPRPTMTFAARHG
jgi:hypothetical protein